MITKVYFPRLVVPMASVLSGVVDFMIAFIVLLGMMVYFNIQPTSSVWTLPLFILLALVTALGAGLWLSALNVIFRDVGYVIPYLTQFWFFVTPIIYSDVSFIEENLASGFSSYPLWIAEYSSTPPTAPGDWDEWLFWQYSQSGSVDGVDGNSVLPGLAVQPFLDGLEVARPEPVDVTVGGGAAVSVDRVYTNPQRMFPAG